MQVRRRLRGCGGGGDPSTVRRWFDNPDMTVLYIERYLIFGLTPGERLSARRRVLTTGCDKTTPRNRPMPSTKWETSADKAGRAGIGRTFRRCARYFGTAMGFAETAFVADDSYEMRLAAVESYYPFVTQARNAVLAKTMASLSSQN